MYCGVGCGVEGGWVEWQGRKGKRSTGRLHSLLLSAMATVVVANAKLAVLLTKQYGHTEEVKEGIASSFFFSFLFSLCS